MDSSPVAALLSAVGAEVQAAMKNQGSDLFRQGVVDYTYQPDPGVFPRVQWDGEPELDGTITETYSYLLPYLPCGGDRVLAVRTRGTWVLLGQIPWIRSISSGYIPITAPYEPAIGEVITRALRDTTQNLATSTAVTFMSWTSKELDKMNNIDLVNTPDEWVCNYPGEYEFSGGSSFTYNGTGTRRVLLRLNGANVSGTATTVTPVPSLISSLSFRTTSLSLTPGDVVQVEAWQNSGSTLTTSAADAYKSSLTVKYVGR